MPVMNTLIYLAVAVAKACFVSQGDIVITKSKASISAAIITQKLYTQDEKKYVKIILCILALSS